MGFLVQKWPFRDAQQLFKKKGPKTPIFIVLFGFRFFGPRCKKGKFWKATQKKGKICLITEKLVFGIFAVFFCWLLFFLLFCLFFFCSFVFVFFFGGFKGQVRWPEGPPHLALNPPYYFLCFFCLFVCFCFVFLLVFCWFFFGGFKGQVRWPEGPPHLALNPPYLFLLFLLFCFCFGFVFWLLNTKKPCFPPEKGIFCLFSVFLFLSPLAFFGPPSFSVSLSLSLSFLFLSLFLLVFVFDFFWFLVWVSFFIFLSSLAFFHERNNIKIFNCKFFFSEIFSLFLVSCLFLFQVPFLSLLFPDFMLCFLFNIKVVDFQTNNLQKKQFLVKRGVATKRFFFLSTCVLENVKSYRFFWAILLAIFGWCSKNTIKIGISAHF